MELKATELPMLMRESRQAMRKDMRTLLRGISHPGWTWEKKALKGTPLSRAKAKSWREHVATLLTQPKTAMMVVMDARTVAPETDLVALYRTWIWGWPVGVLITVLTSPRQKQKVTSMRKPRMLFTTAVAIMARGSV